jgi:hypothetical protein
MAAADRPDVISRKLNDPTSRGYTPLQTLYLLRLLSLSDRRRQLAGTLPPSDWRVRLVDKALYSTYSDCLQIGLADEAQALVRQARQAANS